MMEAEIPSVEEVCIDWGLRDVEMPFDDLRYSELKTYKDFVQYVSPILQKANPKVPSSKIMMLIAAKWRAFCAENPCMEKAPAKTSGGEDQAARMRMEFEKEEHKLKMRNLKLQEGILEVELKTKKQALEIAEEEFHFKKWGFWK